MTYEELVKAAEEVDKDIIIRYGKNHPYYSATKLLKEKDVNKKNPTCFISTTNRTAGKTSFLALLVKKIYDMYGAKTLFLIRKVSDLKGFSRMFDDVRELYEWENDIEEKLILKDALFSLTMNGTEFAFVASLKKDEELKKFSPIFKDVWLIVEDEYQLEKGKFIKNEIANFRSIYRSASRGGGQQVRETFIFLSGNPVSLMNPYLLEFKIASKYQLKKHYIKEKRVVGEFIINPVSAQQIADSGASELFDNGVDYDCGIEFLVDDKTYMEKCKGKSIYLFTLVYARKSYGIRKYLNDNIVHMGKKHDPSCKLILAFKENDRQQNIDLLERRDYTFSELRNAYKYNRLRFDSLDAKNAAFEILGIDLFN